MCSYFILVCFFYTEDASFLYRRNICVVLVFCLFATGRSLVLSVFFIELSLCFSVLLCISILPFKKKYMFCALKFLGSGSGNEKFC
jgi:hypothetical protein